MVTNYMLVMGSFLSFLSTEETGKAGEIHIWACFRTRLPRHI